MARKLSTLDRLVQGPARGLGAANALAEEACGNAGVLGDLLAALEDGREVVVHRAANALRKVQQQNASLLAPHARRLLRLAMTASHSPGTQWNLTIIAGKLPLRGALRAQAVAWMMETFADAKGILRAFALTALANQAQGDEALTRRVQGLVAAALDDPAPSVRARARQLERQLRARSKGRAGAAARQGCAAPRV